MDDQKKEELFRAFVARLEKYGDRKVIAELELFMEMELEHTEESDDLMFEREVAFWGSLHGPDGKTQQVVRGTIPEPLQGVEARVQG